MAWLDGTTIGLVLPAPAGGDAVDWRLVSVAVASGKQALVASHLPPRTPAVAVDGCLFYCLPDAAGLWALWAASADGLTKRRLLAAPDSLELRVECVAEGRLFLNRQYMEGAASGLHNELIEVAVADLPNWRIAAGQLASPLSERTFEVGDQPPPTPADSHGDFIPDESAPDAGSRYKRRGGEEQNPPDLSLPGL
jgi:hypothetical protein